MWSTAGDQSSTAMINIREQCLAEIDAGIRGDCCFQEWSIPNGVDPRDERFWRWANPALGTTVKLSSLRAASKKESFIRQHLNQWVTARGAMLDPGVWDAQQIIGELPPGGILAVDSSLDDSRYVGVRSVQIPEGVQVHVEFVAETEDEMWNQIRRVMDDPNVQLTITPGLEIHTPFNLKRRTTTFGYGELTKYTDLIRKAITERRLWHNGSAALAEHVNRAVLVKTNATYVVSSKRSPGPIELCRCMIVSAALASRPVVRTKAAFASS